MRKRKEYKKPPTYQMIIQIGMFPRISRYFVSAVEYFTRDGAIRGGEKWLAREGYDVSRKFIHTRRVWRGPNLEIKTPKLECELPKRDRDSLKVEYWIHEPKLRKQLGIKAQY